MPITSTTLSSVGTSRPVNLDWSNGDPTSVSVVTTSSSGTSSFNIQYTLDDIMLTASSLVAWQGVSSAIGGTGTVFNTSTFGTAADGVLISLLTPVAAVRLNATAMSSSPLTLRVLQGGL